MYISELLTKNIMKKFLFNLSFLAIIGTLLVFYAGCNGDENGDEEVSDLVGFWTVSDIEIDLSVGGQSLLDLLMNVGGLSEEEANLIIADIESQVMDEIGGTGTIEIRSDGTYISNFGGTSDDGTWNLSSDEKTLTLDAGTIDEIVLNVSSLTSNMLIITQTEITEEDFEGIPVEILMEITMTLTK